MESRGVNTGRGSSSRPAVARRSCDQCRARKIGCERGSPCANCISAKVRCTYSAVASSTAAPKQRVLISAQYEQKIDTIAKDIDRIKQLLDSLSVSQSTDVSGSRPAPQTSQTTPVRPFVEHQSVSATAPGEARWDHSSHIIDFVKAVIQHRGTLEVGAGEAEVLSSLRGLVKTLDSPAAGYKAAGCRRGDGYSMPPLEAAVAVLRWAKAHKGYTRIQWISQILSLDKFTDICQKVYFAVEDYSEVDVIIANGYLSYMFFEHDVATGLKGYRDHHRICRQNLSNAVLRLPLLLPPSMEAIAALTLGALHAIEDSKGGMAWPLISTASELCQTLGYHRLPSFSDDANHNQPPSQTAAQQQQQNQHHQQQQLFWAVYKLEKALSLRHGRPSRLHDSDITLPAAPDDPHPVRFARIQGRVYDQLYSPAGFLSPRPEGERRVLAGKLAREMRGLVEETRAEAVKPSNDTDDDADPLRVLYLNFDLVCQSSMLALILRAIPEPGGGVSDDCVAVAREVLAMHEQCMAAVRGAPDPLMVTKYLNWAILNTPFVPFSILFTRAVQLRDAAELARLDRFTASLRPVAAVAASPDLSTASTHPYRLYKLLCEAARLYFDANGPGLVVAGDDPTQDPDSLGVLGFGHDGMETVAGADEAGEYDGDRTQELSDWFYGNQQLMALLDENVMF